MEDFENKVVPPEELERRRKEKEGVKEDDFYGDDVTKFMGGYGLKSVEDIDKQTRKELESKMIKSNEVSSNEFDKKNEVIVLDDAKRDKIKAEKLAEKIWEKQEELDGKKDPE